MTRLLIALVGILGSSCAWAHGWYDPDCCSQKDCAPYHGEVRETPQGYYLPEFNQTIPYQRVRWTVPADEPEPYHVCVIEGRENGEVFRYIQCFYARMGGV